jgi:hypothetical protein
MTRSIESTLRFAFATSALAGTLFACAGATDDAETDWSGDTATHEDELRRSWRARRALPSPPDAGVVDPAPRSDGVGNPGGGRIVDVSGSCEVCARAQACCNEAQGGALCTFSAPTCEALEPAARAAYVENCKVLIQTVSSVRKVLPASCL